MTVRELLNFLDADLFIPNLPKGDKRSTLTTLVQHLKAEMALERYGLI